MHTLDKISVMKAWADGKPVQYRNESTNNVWTMLDPDVDPQWNWGVTDYRVKPNIQRKQH